MCFVRFGRTKGEIQVEKGNFQGDLGGFRGWTLFGNQPPHPPTFEKNLPEKKRIFFWGGGLYKGSCKKDGYLMVTGQADHK